MSRDTIDLSSALREYVARRAAGGGPHPDRDELVAYHLGELSDDRGERIREHLALCPECTEWLLDYRELDRSDPAEGDAVAATWQSERGTAWDEIQRRIGGLESGAPAFPAPPSVVRRQLHDRPLARWVATSFLAAACLVLAVLLWRANAEIQAPPPPTEVVSLLPADSGILRGGASPDRLVVRPPSGHRLVVQLAYVGTADDESLAAEIFPPTGEGAAWTVEVTRQAGEAFAVDLGTDPAPGRYRIVLHGVEEGEPRELATYGFRIGMAEPE